MITLGGNVKKTVSLVLRIFNDYDMNEVKNPQITLNGIKRKKISKAGGYNVYVGLEERKYEIGVQHQEFINKNITVDLKKLDPLNPVVNLRLKPLAESFYESGGAVIKLSSQKGDEMIRAYIEDSPIGELTKDVDENKGIIYIQKYFNDIMFGDILFLEDEDKGEFVEVLSVEKNKCKITDKLKNSHPQGTKIKRAFESQCDSKGNGLVYFNNLIKKKNKINILLGEEWEKIEVDIDSFNTNLNLGKINRAE